MSDPVPSPGATGFVCRLARGQVEQAGYFDLRRQIFCHEQGVFASDDRDAIDDRAFGIVCLDPAGRVAGVVRIWEETPGLWWGGRLGVHPDHRTLAVLGRSLVRAAVGTARAWGARQFRATVQRPNVAFFRRLHWRSLGELDVHGQPHHLMEAELARYPLVHEPRPARVDRAA
jgi:putative N-acetyltransferase (TIGR04045 family)